MLNPQANEGIDASIASERRHGFQGGQWSASLSIRGAAQPGWQQVSGVFPSRWRPGRTNEPPCGTASLGQLTSFRKVFPREAWISIERMRPASSIGGATPISKLPMSTIVSNCPTMAGCFSPATRQTETEVTLDQAGQQSHGREARAQSNSAIWVLPDRLRGDALNPWK